MIVVSGALVVLSIILLVTGLVASDDLTLIYISIGSSVLAGIFLLLGALQRRDSKPSASAAAPEASTAAFERVTTVNVTKAPTTAAASSAAAGAGAAAAGAGSAVSVVPGRPRFHTDDCRFLAGRPDVESIAVDDARAQGYTECGVCKPSESMAAGARTQSMTPALMNDDDVSAQADDALDNEVAAATRRGATDPKAPARTAATRTAATRTGSTTTARATKAAPARTAAKAATARTAAKAATPRTAVKATVPTAAKAAPARTAAKAAPARTAAKAPSKTTRAAAKSAPAGSVVVIPDRDKFHTTECRFVRDVDGTLTVSKATARRQGYLACGVCKP
ncbi:MAG TPA: hypothetical protein VNB94_10880 [Mycobacteriales bacterium]|nr:hypothetical protein [Mycobacteriales bacterium]